MIIVIDPERVSVIAAAEDDQWTPVRDFMVGEPLFVGAGDCQPSGPWYSFTNAEGDTVYGPLSSLNALGVKSN